jgi:hypothetical protein
MQETPMTTATTAIPTPMPRRPLPLALAALLSLGACELDPEVFGPHCDQQPTAAVGGQWRLEASGDRAGCQGQAVPNAEGVRISSMALPVAQSGESLWLSSPLSAAPTFALDGDVLGRCVRFWTAEQTEYGEVTYTFGGSAAGTHISGRFTALGPGTCRTEGTFTVRVVR